VYLRAGPGRQGVLDSTLDDDDNDDDNDDDITCTYNNIAEQPNMSSIRDNYKISR
jgi:hypothetical protein